MLLRNPLRAAVAALALFVSIACPGAVPVLRADVEAFIEEMAGKHGFEPGPLRRLFGTVQPRPSIIRAMSAPGTARPWYDFRRRHVDPGRIEGGVRFWAANAAVLERAGREFGVPPEVIVATIGIETLYGRNMGGFRVIDALSTLAFDYPPRADFFRRELEEYLLLTRDWDISTATRGSYAGAIGIPQFIPSSYRKYAIDFDGDGRRDLVASPADAIGSVANYYQTYGWKAGAPVVSPANTGELDVAPFIAQGIKPHTPVGELKAKGFTVMEPVDDATVATIFQLETESGPRVMLGFNNFYVITRYNRSQNYAMAVYELSREIRTAYGAQ
ncbi:MAG TPA: lytic murein transglycosylase B [Burkholderiales bacterium]|nr:lytic murein transglycosylase B [Burkholderiales bacterium]